MKAEQAFLVEISSSEKEVCVLWKGSVRYLEVLRGAFPQLSWRLQGPESRAYGQHVARSHLRAGEMTSILQELRRLAAFIGSAYLVDAGLDECWVMGKHWDLNSGARTKWGDLLLDAKTYEGKPGDPARARELGNLVATSCARHPGLALVDAIVGVPANPEKHPHNLPDILAAAVSRACGPSVVKGLLLKPRPTPEIKRLAAGDRERALAGAYHVSERVEGSSILVVDDLVRSGSTLRAIAQVLREAGADRVIGVAVTKALRA